MKDLQELLETFANGDDRSLGVARLIEGHIASLFPPDHAIQELADAFAQYSPGGGSLLHSEEDVLPWVAFWLQRMREGQV